jgi:hypothetical protein
VRYIQKGEANQKLSDLHANPPQAIVMKQGMTELAVFAQRTLAVNKLVLGPFHSMLRQLFGKLACPCTFL